MKHALAVSALALALAACSSSGSAPTSVADAQAQVNAAVPDAFKYGCAAVAYANVAFVAAAPALQAAGKLTAEDVANEKATFATSEATCAAPPADAASAGLALLGQASAIYLLLAPKA